jgi:hypothetical protein
MFKITSIVASVHHTGFGGLPYKVTAIVQMPIAEFNKLCPVIGKPTRTYFGLSKTKRNLGNLVLAVNNAVYKAHSAIPAYNPSIDSQGARRAKNGVKTLEFVYFFDSRPRAIDLGFQHHGNGAVKYGQHINLGSESL